MLTLNKFIKNSSSLKYDQKITEKHEFCNNIVTVCNRDFKGKGE